MTASSLDRIERFAVRVVLFDCAGSVLLLSTRDSSNAGFPQSWETPGGGLLESEAPRAGVAREVLEETGIRLDRENLNGPFWCRDVIYTYRGQRRLQHETIFTASIDHRAPRIDTGLREAFEMQDHLNYRWWAVEEIRVSTALFYPRSLPLHISALIAGKVVDEPLEIWEELD